MHGWNHNHEDVLYTEAKVYHRYAVSKGRSGGEYLFKGYLDNSYLVVDSKNFKKGITNCNKGAISGRTNVLNHRLSKNNGFTYSLHTGSGAVMHFDKKFGQDHYHQIIYQNTPSDYHIDYSYNKDTKRLSQVVLKSPQKRPLLTLNFKFPTDSYLKNHCKDKKGWRKKPKIVVTTSDGRYIKYTLQAFDRHYDEELKIDRRRFRVSKISRSNAPEESYEYSKATCCCPEKVIRKNRPDGRYLEIEYYSKGNKFSLDKVSSLRGPAGVSSDPVILYQFFYEKQSSTSAKTLVQDGLGHRVNYYYNPKNFRLKSIEKLNGNSTYSLHSTEELVWGDEENGSPLLSREIFDYNQKLILKRAYEYDSRGNILKNVLHGNLTGDSTYQTYEKTFSYSNDGFNLMTSSKEGGVIKEFRYLLGTDLVTAEITKAGPFSKRTFYSYDENNILSLIVNDDGCGNDLNDLYGVTERQIQRIHNTKVSPVGLPESIEVLYLDLTTHAEILLKKTAYKYDELGRCIEEVTIDSSGNVAATRHYEYNDYGQKIQEIDPVGSITRYSYDMNGNMLTEHRLSDNKIKAYTYDLCNRLIKTETRRDNELYVESLEYDLIGNKISSTNIYGNKTCYQYDAFGQLSTIIHPEIVDETGTGYVRKEFREYDVLGNLSLVVDGNQLYTYTDHTVRGAPYSIRHPDGTIEQFEYSLTGNLIKYTDQNGTVTITDYDELSRPVSETIYNKQAEPLRKRIKRYNSLHLIEEIDADGLVTRYSYDGAGRIVRIEKGNTIQTITYDDLGRKAVIKNGNFCEAVMQITKYDLLDRIILDQTLSISGDLQSQNEYLYDCDGNCIETKTYNHAGTIHFKREYNTLGHLTKEIDPHGNVFLSFVESATWKGDFGYRITDVDPLGNQKIRYYNAVGEIVCELIKNPFGDTIKETTFVYDHAGNRTVQINNKITPNKPVESFQTRWDYDAMNRVISVKEAIDSEIFRTTLKSYDKSGNLKVVTKPNNVQITYEYDPLGRIERYFSSDKTIDYWFKYENSNDPVSIYDHINGTYTFRNYDENRRLIEEEFQNGIRVSFQYDTLGRITEIFYPDGCMVKYSYNGVLMVSVERFAASGELIYTHLYTKHDLSGNTLQSKLIGNLGEVNYEYDLLNRTKKIATPFWQEKNHCYDAVGNLVSREWDDVSFGYEYDHLYQLQSESGYRENSYQNDSMFNQVIVNGVERKFNHACELQGVYRYDVNGNVIKKGDISFEYDALNRLKKVILPKLSVEYQYDSYHRRVSKLIDGSLVENYFFNSQNELGAVDKNGKVFQARILGRQLHADIGAAIAMEIDGNVYAPLHDSQGNVVTLIDFITKKMVESCRFTAYGQEIAELSEGVLLSPWRCASKRLEREAMLLDFGRRFYDSQEMRWISPDPILLSEGTNRYNYLENNPFKFIDPDGRFAIILPIAIWAWGSLTAAAVTITATDVALACVAVAGATAVYAANKNGITIRSSETVFVGGTFYTGVESASKTEWGTSPTSHTCPDTLPEEVPAPPVSALDEKKTKKRFDVYAPDRPLPLDEYGVVLPDTDSPHTQLGTRTSSKGDYAQGREFGQGGKKIKDIDFTDHRNPSKHPNPHEHKWNENKTGGSPSRGKPEVLQGWNYL